ncbi:site-specific DNA-methyltransferase [Rhizobium acidisoli]|uniref:Methyltransferase n=1 Tax=Rhizobium acidisoli TaxID=1538158 RepID=A0AAE5WNP0_9HYPH|nr:site-specific DNA-methyltransferase [Rhizobium acidisoli]KPH04260.1 DNA methyltransferase [Rhizobium acidisoli]QAS78573.1 site-specific DNA-methyltransferase [Rhizobium acidisoli]
MFYQPARGNAEAIGLCALHTGDCAEVLPQLPTGSVDLVVTSPPYNIGKAYEKRAALDAYVDFQTGVINECVRLLGPDGSICWQVGNWVDNGEIVPLDSVVIPIFRALGMKIRSRVVWTFGHGMHCRRRLSGRHETIVWATKSDEYHFDLDSIRVPQKYPNKRHYKGPKMGQLSGNPLGKNPGDVWDISNVKNRHPEKTSHPCQFPEELVERLVKSLTKPGQKVLDPFAGAGTVGAVCNRLDRKSVLVERVPEYVDIIRERLGGPKAQARRPVSDVVALAPRMEDLFTVSVSNTTLAAIDPSTVSISGE